MRRTRARQTAEPWTTVTTHGGKNVGKFRRKIKKQNKQKKNNKKSTTKRFIASYVRTAVAATANTSGASVARSASVPGTCSVGFLSSELRSRGSVRSSTSTARCDGDGGSGCSGVVAGAWLRGSAGVVRAPGRSRSLLLLLARSGMTTSHTHADKHNQRAMTYRPTSVPCMYIYIIFIYNILYRCIPWAVLSQLAIRARRPARARACAPVNGKKPTRRPATTGLPHFPRAGVESLRAVSGRSRSLPCAACSWLLVCNLRAVSAAIRSTATCTLLGKDRLQPAVFYRSVFFSKEFFQAPTRAWGNFPDPTIRNVVELSVREG